MILVKPKSLKQEYEQVNKPYHCDLEVQSKHENDYTENQVEVHCYGVEYWPNHLQLPKQVTEFVLHVIESLSNLLIVRTVAFC